MTSINNVRGIAQDNVATSVRESRGAKKTARKNYRKICYNKQGLGSFLGKNRVHCQTSLTMLARTIYPILKNAGNLNALCYFTLV